MKLFSEIYSNVLYRAAEARHQNNSPQSASYREGEQRDYNQSGGQISDSHAYQGYTMPQDQPQAYAPAQRQGNQAPSSMMDKVNMLATEFIGKNH